jgi:hypothetical protein
MNSIMGAMFFEYPPYSLWLNTTPAIGFAHPGTLLVL